PARGQESGAVRRTGALCDVADVARKVAPFARKQADGLRANAEEMDAADWFERGLDLEPVDMDQAREVAAAAAHYRLALRCREGDVTASYNLGVALADLGRHEEAVDAYEKA